MSAPAVNMLQLKGTPSAPEISAGEDSPPFVAIAPLVEPISAGALPVTPSLVARGRAAAYPVRRMRTRSGHPKSSPLCTAGAGRAVWTVSWGAITTAEAEQLRAFLEDDVIAAEGSGGLYGFDLRPDGPDGDLVVVRPRGALRTRSADGIGTELAAELECEQIFGSE